jgi:hypothetical protein
VALRREQLDSNHCENQATGKEGENDHRCYKYSPQKRRSGGTPVKLFETNSLKEGAMWHVDPLLGNDHEISDYTTAVAR